MDPTCYRKCNNIKQSNNTGTSFLQFEKCSHLEGILHKGSLIKGNLPKYHRSEKENGGLFSRKGIADPKTNGRHKMRITRITGRLHLTGGVHVVGVTSAQKRVQITNAQKMLKVPSLVNPEALAGLHHQKDTGVILIMKIGSRLGTP